MIARGQNVQLNSNGEDFSVTRGFHCFEITDVWLSLRPMQMVNKFVVERWRIIGVTCFKFEFDFFVLSNLWAFVCFRYTHM